MKAKMSKWGRTGLATLGLLLGLGTMGHWNLLSQASADMIKVSSPTGSDSALVSDQKNVHYYGTLYEAAGRDDALYLSAPYGIAGSVKVSQTFPSGREVVVTQEETVTYPDGGKTVYAEVQIYPIVHSPGNPYYSKLWVDTAALIKTPYDKVTNWGVGFYGPYETYIDVAGREDYDAYFTEGPYNTSGETQVPAGKLSQYDGQKVTAVGGAAVEGADGKKTQWVQVSLADGTKFWMDSSALYPNKVISGGSPIDKTAVIRESVRGGYDSYFLSGPYNTSPATRVPDGPLSQYEGQRVHLTEMAATIDGSNNGTAWVHAYLPDGTNFWMDPSALGNTAGAIVGVEGSGHIKAMSSSDQYFIHGPYNTSSNTLVGAGLVSQYEGQAVTITEKVKVTAFNDSTRMWAHVYLADGTNFWVDTLNINE